MNRQIIQEAADWFVELNSDSPADLATRARFDQWLRTSPEHVRAFLELIPIWEDGSQLPQAPGATPEQLIEWAREGTNIIAMQAERRPRGGAEARRARADSPRHSRRQRWAIGWVAVLVVAVGAVLVYRAVQYPTYVTGIGEQRSLVLADNSFVDLNAHSKVRVRYSGDERAIDLIEGQALFRVARSPSRPFVVYVGQTRVRAVGTEFDVYRKSSGTVITVVEGRVSVGSGDAVEPKEALSAGEQLTVAAGGRHKAEHANLAGVTAWTQRQLVFDSTPLPEVAEEFNRYNTRRLSVAPAHLEDFRVSGIFSSTDPGSLVRFLREQPGVRVEESEREIRVSSD